MEEFLNRRSEEVKQFFYVVDGLLLKLDGLKINCRPALGGERFLTNTTIGAAAHQPPGVAGLPGQGDIAVYRSGGKDFVPGIGY